MRKARQIVGLSVVNAYRLLPLSGVRLFGTVKHTAPTHRFSVGLDLLQATRAAIGKHEILLADMQLLLFHDSKMRIIGVIRKFCHLCSVHPACSAALRDYIGSDVWTFRLANLAHNGISSINNGHFACPNQLLPCD
jgi:hypothetical protein